jgi:hypothetical protein
MRLAALALLLTGCIRHVPIGTEQLVNLNGFGEQANTEAAAPAPAEGAAPETAAPEAAPPTPKDFTLVDRDGEAHPFTTQTQLYLVDDHGKRKGGSFTELQIDAKTLSGELVDGTQLKANLDALDHAELDVRDVGTGVAIGVSLGIALIAVVVIGAMAMNGLPQ